MAILIMLLTAAFTGVFASILKFNDHHITLKEALTQLQIKFEQKN